MRIIKAIFAVTVPGGAAVLRKGYLLGAAVLALWVALVEAYVVLRIVSPEGLRGYVMPALVWGAVGISAANALVAALFLWRDSRVGPSERRALYREALEAFARGDDAECERILKGLLWAGAPDVDCLFLRAQAAAGGGRSRRAKRLFRKCRDFDEKGKWDWEIRNAIEKL
ncbi:MAG: hypothetical protein J7M19_09000 [Planctomycetes bacterium]|nr:hypothetical protein [Planctomycetota bacterium]